MAFSQLDFALEYAAISRRGPLEYDEGDSVSPPIQSHTLPLELEKCAGSLEDGGGSRARWVDECL
jgi:hypothetical protein